MAGTDQQDTLMAIRCQLGDPLAWEELVRRWHPRLWRFVLGMLSDRTSAEDVLQNVWLRVIRSLVRLREPEKLSAWLYGIARSAITDRLREQYRHPPADEVSEVSDSDDSLKAVDVSDSLRAGLAQLHPADREVVVLFYFEERSLDEVAEISRIPSGTVKSRLHRARRVIREALEQESAEHDQA